MLRSLTLTILATALGAATLGAAAPQTETLPRDSSLVQKDMCEVSPVIWNGRPALLKCVRPGEGGTKEDYSLHLVDVESGNELATFGLGHSLACAFVHDNTFYAYAARFEDNNWNDVTVFKSADLKNWEQKVAITQDPKEHLFNSSVCAAPGGFIMAYETNDPAYPAFTIKFARSKDLLNWEKIPEALLGRDRYTACPTIRHAGDWYYVLYLEHRTPKWFFETCIARSNDLTNWTLASGNPVLTPTASDDGINASDPDLVEVDGKTILYYAVGDQKTWMNIKKTTYPQPLTPWIESWFTGPGTPTK